jgi:DNA-binding SARP family transcriptional activator
MHASLSPKGSLPVLAREPATHSAVTQEAEALRIQLLGDFCVSVGSRVLDDDKWYLRKARSLVKLLALAPPHRLHREQIMDILWPEMDPESAANNLHKALYVARHILEPTLPSKGASLYLHLQRDFVVLALPGASWIDVEAFQATAQAARLSQDPALYKEALRLYEGDLLPEDRCEDWAAEWRETLKALQLSLLLELAELQERSNHLDAAMEALRQVVATDPLHEEAHFQLMRLLVQTGQRHLALRHFQKLRDALRQELEAAPDPRIQQLYQQILCGTRALDACSASGTPQTPPRRAPLVGRERELADVEERVVALLSGCGGLVLVRGEEGIGKTRLAAEIREYAAQVGALTLWGGAHIQEGPFPHNPLGVALEGFAQRAALAGIDAELGAAGGKLAGLLRARASLPDPGQPAVDSTTPDRRSLFRATADFLSRLAANTSVVVVLDDLHLADVTNLNLLRYLAGAVRNVSVLLLGTYRPEAVSPANPLASLVLQLEQERLAQCLQLARLGFSATVAMVTALLGGSIDQPVYERVHALADGNPHYTEEAVHALRGRGQLRETDGQWRLQIDTAILPNCTFLRRSRSR